MEVGDKIICKYNKHYEPFLTIGKVYIVDKVYLTDYEKPFISVMCDDDYKRKVAAKRFDFVTLKRSETINSILYEEF